MSEQTARKSIPRVVVIEDNPGDVRLVEEGVETADAEIDLHVLNSGTKAIDWLTSNAQQRPPHLVFLDLNLPGATGFEVLETVRGDADLSDVPVVVVSSSENPDDIRRAYEATANAYITKPTDPDRYIQMIVAAVDFWITTVDTPHE